MTRSLPFSRRLIVIASALIYTMFSFGIVTNTAPLAAQNAPYYVAELAQPAAKDRVVAGGVAWVCRDTTCVANRGNSRPLRMCRGLSREVGELSRFTTDGEVLAEDRLARCNGN
ncbi:MAG: hypothetical protein WA936_09655 [Erythrobacter sp.]|uniref:CC_3452 family protein n=1 Tax=Erythrobacter sp. TaxID=1042 RepID=UPI003C777342